MSGTEVKGLPLGNEWEFSERNSRFGLEPNTGIEIKRPSSQLQDLIKYVHASFINEEWSFTSLVSFHKKTNSKSFDVYGIFTHPARVNLEKTAGDDIDKFIKPETIKNSGSTDRNLFFGGEIPRADDPMNQILKGTNLVVITTHAGYNIIEDDEGGLLRQTGVGYFDLGLITLDWSISQKTNRIEEFMAKVRPLQEERKALQALQSSNPVKLFN